MARTKKYQMGGLASPQQNESVFIPKLDVVKDSQTEAAPTFSGVYSSPQENVNAQSTALPRSVRMPMGMQQPAMAKGGVLLEEGGMLQEGGTVDPVSGNEVPVGSMQEEVRDDIPAKLSEGEFVFPADVVRYIGLERLMQMRQAAKEGLAKMEDMGQMGNSEEATMSDGADTDFESEIDEILEEIEKEEEK
jgi:hypothetical protein